MATMLKNLVCCNCGAQLTFKEADLVLFCSKCGTTMEFTGNNVIPIQVNFIANPKKKSDFVYVPFWVIYADVSVTYMVTSPIHIFTIRSDIPMSRRESKRIGESKLIKLDNPLKERQKFYVCASQYVEESWNVKITRSTLNDTSDLGNVMRIPADKPSNIADKDAEFLFLKHMVAMDGVLQDIKYKFNVLGHKVVYIPCKKSEKSYVPLI